MEVYNWDIYRKFSPHHACALHFNHQWTEETLLEKMREDQKDDHATHLELYHYLKNNSDDVKYGTGASKDCLTKLKRTPKNYNEIIVHP